LAVAIALLQVIQTSSFAHTGQTLQQLETQKASLSAQTKNLEAEVAALSSLDRIDRTARDSLGMVPARNIEYLNVALEAPQGALLPRPLLTASTAEAVQKSQPWWRTLLSALPLP
jgi:cell division protein FtsL